MNTHASSPKKGRKYDQVIEGAWQVFMREGFEGASVDAIARAAGVSKATLYSYFSDKKLLFIEVARTECLRQADTAIVMGQSGQSARETLTNMAQRMVRFYLSDLGQRVFRICVAEADRFPEIGRSFYECGPELARRRVASYLQEAVSRGELMIEDCQLAADQFAELCKADLFPRMMFNITDHITQEEIDRVINGAVDMFMARYGPV